MDANGQLVREQAAITDYHGLMRKNRDVKGVELPGITRCFGYTRRHRVAGLSRG